MVLLKPDHCVPTCGLPSVLIRQITADLEAQIFILISLAFGRLFSVVDCVTCEKESGFYVSQ